jgi:secretion/DNA translocation related TadE-like protein
LAVGLVLVLFAGALASVGAAVNARHRARTAADLAALAGAARALEGASVACGRASEYAAANGAGVRACRLDGFDLIVTVAVSTRFGPAVASARAGPVPPDSAAAPPEH